MTRELEIAGGASLGGWLGWRRRHANLPPGTPCANCATPLQGAYCHVCGQLAEDFHKSIFLLVLESIESFFHFDGRLWRTLPKLAFNPGALTRAYLDGQRAPQIPPFRLFLVVLLVAFFVGHFASGQKEESLKFTPAPVGVEVGEAADVGEAAAVLRRGVETAPDLSPEQRRQALEKMQTAESRLKETGFAEVKFEAPAAAKGERAKAFEHWAQTRVKAIQDDPERFLLLLEIWAHRVAVLMLPMAALFLTVLFAFQRRFYVFDHLVFSMHSLSFQLLLLTAVMLLSLAVGPAAWWLALLTPIHLFMHLRGVYSTGGLSTVVRMGGLFLMTVFGFSALAVLWFYLGLRAMGGH